MRRFVPRCVASCLALALLLVAGCADDGGPTPLPTAAVSAGFRRGGLIDVITVSALDRLPLRSAELVAPDGGSTAANDIEVTRSPSFQAGQFSVGDPWRTGLSANGAAPIIAIDPQADAALRSQGRLLMTVSTATVPLPDPVAYRRDWRGYRLRLGFGVAGDTQETREIPAPAPAAPPG